MSERAFDKFTKRAKQVLQIATEEARAIDGYKQAIVEGSSDDIVYSNLFTGVHGNYLKRSILSAGLDPDNLPQSDPSKMNFGGDAKKAWKDIWGCGQGIGAVKGVVPTRTLVQRLAREYRDAQSELLLSAREAAREVRPVQSSLRTNNCAAHAS